MDKTARKIGDDDRFNAWLNLLQAYSVVTSRIEARLDAATGLSLPEHEVLIRLSQTPEQRMRMLDLSGLLLLSKSGVTRLVDRLEKRGLVERKMSPDDRRVVHAELTDGGSKALADASPVLAAAIKDVFSQHLTDRDVTSLRATLRKILRANGIWSEQLCSPTFPTEATPAVGA